MTDFNLIPDAVLVIKSFIENLGFSTKAHSGEPCSDPECYVIHAFGSDAIGNHPWRNFIIFIDRSGMVSVKRRASSKNNQIEIVGEPVLDISLSNPKCFDKLNTALNLRGACSD